MNILITGANGFIGTYLCKALSKKNVNVIPVLRAYNSNENENIIIKEINAKTDWTDSLKRIDVVVHLAGRAHVMKEEELEPYKAFASVNVEGTKNLALQAAANGAKRFVFVSSIGVNGNTTRSFFNELQKPDPKEHYAISKKNAEDELRKVASQTGLEVVVIRPPLVYGRGAKGNFEQLSKACSLNLPLPFGSVKNKRSLIYVENLVDFIVTCINHPMAANELFLVSDDEDVSTTYLIKNIKSAMGKKKLLFSLPQKTLHFLSILIGKESTYNRLCGNLQVDISKAKKVLNWKPPYTFEEGIKRTFNNK